MIYIEKLKKVMLIVCGCFIIFFIILFIVSGCNKTYYTSEQFTEFLLEKAKIYFKNNENALPQINGGKISLSIANLVENQNDYLENITCSGTIDVINNNNFYMYVPNINCSDGYEIKKLNEHLINNDANTNSNGLYELNGSYVYRGDNVNNYIVFNNQLFRILRINNDNSLRIIETDYQINNKKNSTNYKTHYRISSTWDNRFNSDKNFNSGFNDLIHNNINSRIKDELDKIYKNDFSDQAKAYIIPQDLCIGKRSIDETINDGSVECSTILENQYIGLLPVYEYLIASLDSNCNSIDDNACKNYNYLTDLKTTYWSMTAVEGNTFEVYKISNKIIPSTANSTAKPKIVLNLSSEIKFISGDGSLNNPYIIK